MFFWICYESIYLNYESIFKAKKCKIFNRFDLRKYI